MQCLKNIFHTFSFLIQLLQLENKTVLNPILVQTWKCKKFENVKKTCACVICYCYQLFKFHLLYIQSTSQMWSLLGLSAKFKVKKKDLKMKENNQVKHKLKLHTAPHTLTVYTLYTVNIYICSQLIGFQWSNALLVYFFECTVQTQWNWLNRRLWSFNNLRSSLFSFRSLNGNLNGVRMYEWYSTMCLISSVVEVKTVSCAQSCEICCKTEEQNIDSDISGQQIVIVSEF